MRSFVAILAAVALTLTIAPASAGTRTAGDFVYVKTSLEIDGNGSDGLVDALCPPGSRTTGVGASMSGTNGENSWFNKITGLDLAADADLLQDDGARVEVWNLGAKARKVTAFAVCSKGVDADDQTYNTTLANVTAGTSATFGPVNCLGGAGERVLGGGGGVDNNPFDLVSVQLPFESSVTVGIRGNNPDDRNLQKTAICLPVGMRDITTVEKVIAVRPNEIGGTRATCPSGTRVTGGGGGGGALFTILSSKPIDGPDRDRAPDDGWLVRARNTHVNKTNFSVHAICAGPPL